MQSKISPAVVIIISAVVVVGGLIGIAVWQGNKPSAAAPFAQCLTDKGVKMYGAWWCPHCAAQKALFGSAFHSINYVECSPNGSHDMSQQCKDAGITGFPTWVFPDGTRISGEQTFADLGKPVSCTPPTN